MENASTSHPAPSVQPSGPAQTAAVPNAWPAMFAASLGQPGPTTRVRVAVDLDNLFLSLPYGDRLDFAVLLKTAATFGQILDSRVYLGRHVGSPGERALPLALKHAGFTHVISRPFRIQPNGAKKSDIDVLLATDCIQDALLNLYDVLYLCTGDSDYVPLVERLVQYGKQVAVLGPVHATAWELTVASTHFCSVADVPGLVQGSGGSMGCAAPGYPLGSASMAAHAG